MAKKDKGVVYPYPSRFGSHRSMLVDTGIKIEDDRQVSCQDEFGVYITEKSRLDNGLTDPARCRLGRLAPLFGGKKSKKD